MKVATVLRLPGSLSLKLQFQHQVLEPSVINGNMKSTALKFDRLFPFITQARIIIPLAKRGRQASTGALTSVAMHAGLPYAAR